MAQKYKINTNLTLTTFLTMDIDPLVKIPYQAERLVRLHCGWFVVNDYQYFGELPHIPRLIETIPVKYHTGLNRTKPFSLKYYDAARLFVWELMTQCLPNVGRDYRQIVNYFHKWCVYNPSIIQDHKIIQMIDAYKDPRHIHYTLQQLMAYGILHLTDNHTIRHDYNLVFYHLQSHYPKLIKSKKQLTHGLNKLVMDAYNKTGIVNHWKFGKATRHLQINNVPFTQTR